MTAQLLDSIYLENDFTEFFTINFIPLPKRRSKKWRHFESVVPEDYAESLVNSTCCWRRYVATWRVINNQLHLTEMYGRFRLLQPLHAIWVTQTVRIRREEFLFDPLRDNNTFDFQFQIRNGQVLGLKCFLAV